MGPRRLLFFSTPLTREEAVAGCSAPGPATAAEKEVHSSPSGDQHLVCLFCTTLHSPVLQDLWEDGSWLYQGLGPRGECAGGTSMTLAGYDQNLGDLSEPFSVLR